MGCEEVCRRLRPRLKALILDASALRLPRPFTTVKPAIMVSVAGKCSFGSLRWDTWCRPLCQWLSHGSTTKYKYNVQASTANQCDRNLSFRCLSKSSTAATQSLAPGDGL